MRRPWTSKRRLVLELRDEGDFWPKLGFNLGKIQKDDLVVSYIELNNHGPWLINVNNKPARVRDDSPTHHLWWGQMKWPNSEFCARGLNFQHHVPIMVCHFRLTRKSSRKTIAKWAFFHFLMKLLPRKSSQIDPNWRILQPPNPAHQKTPSAAQATQTQRWTAQGSDLTAATGVWGKCGAQMCLTSTEKASKWSSIWAQAKNGWHTYMHSH